MGGAEQGKAIYGPMIYMATYVMFLMQATSITWASGRGLGPVKWRGAVRQVPFWTQESRDFEGPIPSHLPK